MHKILKAMEYLKFETYLYSEEVLTIWIKSDGSCVLTNENEEYDHCTVYHLTKSQERKVVENLKPKIEVKLKNDQLGFEFF